MENIYHWCMHKQCIVEWKIAIKSGFCKTDHINCQLKHLFQAANTNYNELQDQWEVKGEGNKGRSFSGNMGHSSKNQSEIDSIGYKKVHVVLLFYTAYALTKPLDSRIMCLNTTEVFCLSLTGLISVPVVVGVSWQPVHETVSNNISC